ncbi:MAG: hypothetical protein O7G85_07170 [Planctomycetota bacterium]|nr:hypothetical protein [Planctomycetota bacterium]
MVSFLKEHLRLIRYYSAPRRRSLLTRFVDVALILAIVMAFPAAWLLNAEVVHETILIERDGHLSRLPDGGVSASIVDPDTNGLTRDDIPYGEFHLKLVERRQGWPVSSTVMQPRVTLELNLYDQAGSQRDAHLDSESVEYRAILQALEFNRPYEFERNMINSQSGATSIEIYDDLVARWNDDGANVNHRILGWIFNTGACWVSLSFLLSGGALTFWVVTLLFLHNNQIRQHDRRIEGLCAQCGYDLCGLDFNERCPECGTVIL